MNPKIKNVLGSERSVEVPFVEYAVKKYYKEGDVILDIGGIPSNVNHLQEFYAYLNNHRIDYRVSDFRPSQYQGDFVTLDFKDQKFDIQIFLSSLEHFPQCTESDVVFRPGYDREGFKKALSISKYGGYLILTVPFGKQVWQPYHQNYNWKGILSLTEGASIVEHHIYRLYDDHWILTPAEEMEDVLYTDRAFGVGCFVLQNPS